jgi:hypothetical protein
MNDSSGSSAWGCVSRLKASVPQAKSGSIAQIRTLPEIGRLLLSIGNATKIGPTECLQGGV